MHDEKGVGHVVLLAFGLVQFFGQHIVHRALQEVGHFDIPVPIKDTVQSLTTPAETVYRQSSDAQSEKKQIKSLKHVLGEETTQ